MENSVKQKRGPRPTYTYLVADTKDFDLPVLVTDSLSEVSEFLGLSKQTIRGYMREGFRTGHRYEVTRIPLEEDEQ